VKPVYARYLCAIRWSAETPFADRKNLAGRTGHRVSTTATKLPGEFLYIPANMPHLPYNLSASESCVAVIARTDPNDQESVVLLPELDGAHGP
jgi:uncharacterized RmlC-like cupin family protein